MRISFPDANVLINGKDRVMFRSQSVFPPNRLMPEISCIICILSSINTFHVSYDRHLHPGQVCALRQSFLDMWDSVAVSQKMKLVSCVHAGRVIFSPSLGFTAKGIWDLSKAQRLPRPLAFMKFPAFILSPLLSFKSSFCADLFIIKSINGNLVSFPPYPVSMNCNIMYNSHLGCFLLPS